MKQRRTKERDKGGKECKEREKPLTNRRRRHLAHLAHILVRLHDPLDPRHGELGLHLDPFFHPGRGLLADFLLDFRFLGLAPRFRRRCRRLLLIWVVGQPVLLLGFVELGL